MSPKSFEKIRRAKSEKSFSLVDKRKEPEKTKSSRRGSFGSPSPPVSVD